MYTQEHRDFPTPWNELHDEIFNDVEEHWTVYDLYGYKAQRMHEGHLTDIIEALVQDLYHCPHSYTDIKEVFVKEKNEEYMAYCACSIPPEGKTPEEYEVEYKAIHDTFKDLFEKLLP
mgnify:CR=1 FL=1